MDAKFCSRKAFSNDKSRFQVRANYKSVGMILVNVSAICSRNSVEEKCDCLRPHFERIGNQIWYLLKNDEMILYILVCWSSFPGHKCATFFLVLCIFLQGNARTTAVKKKYRNR